MLHLSLSSEKTAKGTQTWQWRSGLGGGGGDGGDLYNYIWPYSHKTVEYEFYTRIPILSNQNAAFIRNRFWLAVFCVGVQNMYSKVFWQW